MRALFALLLILSPRPTNWSEVKNVFLETHGEAKILGRLDEHDLEQVLSTSTEIRIANYIADQKKNRFQNGLSKLEHSPVGWEVLGAMGVFRLKAPKRCQSFFQRITKKIRGAKWIGRRLHWVRRLAGSGILAGAGYQGISYFRLGERDLELEELEKMAATQSEILAPTEEDKRRYAQNLQIESLNRDLKKAFAPLNLLRSQENKSLWEYKIIPPASLNFLSLLEHVDLVIHSKDETEGILIRMSASAEIDSVLSKHLEDIGYHEQAPHSYAFKLTKLTKLSLARVRSSLLLDSDVDDDDLFDSSAGAFSE